MHYGERTGAPVHAVAVRSAGAPAEEWLHAALAHAGRGRPGSGFRAVVRGVCRAGEPGTVLLAHARHAALLVLGHPGPAGGLGAVAGRCVQEARCPVVLVPSPDPGSVA